METFDWRIVIKDNVYYFRVGCKICSKFVESQAAAFIGLEPESNAAPEKTIAPFNKKIPITIKEAKENLDKYLASVEEELEEATPLEKEYIH